MPTTLPLRTRESAPSAIPAYLQETYWWAYIHPRAVWLFEREWLVNAILLGNYRRLREAALSALGTPLRGHTLQMACVYGDLSARLQAALAPDARLDIVDVLPIQLHNLARKLAPDPRVHLRLGDAAKLSCADGAYDQVLLFFLLHEQPEAVRRATLAEAMRVLRPGGRLVIVDYHEPAPWHPFKIPLRWLLRVLEPFALDLWKTPLEQFLPAPDAIARLEASRYFGGLYQRLVMTRRRPPPEA